MIAPGAAAAWRSVSPRGWWMSGIAGLVYAAALSLRDASPQFWSTAEPLALMAVSMARWSVLVGLLALAIRFGAALTDEIERHRPVGWRERLAVVAGLIAFGLLVADLASFAAQVLTGPLIPADAAGLWRGGPSVDGLLFSWSESIPTVVVLATLGPMIHARLRRAAQDEVRLANAQLRLTQVRRRVLAAELSSAQAMVDPRFLFGTLAAVQRLYGSDAERAGTLLDALIRYLRAAMPAHPEAGSTLGEQAELVRSWLEIEALRAPGRLQSAVEAPAALGARPFAPLLLVPLIAEAARAQIGDGGAGRIEVGIGLDGQRLVVTVDAWSESASDGDRPTAAAAELQARVSALYGADARLTLDQPTPRHTRARLDIADPGDP